MFGDDTVGGVNAEECGGWHHGSDRFHSRLSPAVGAADQL